jgi:hypothetical protein
VAKYKELRLEVIPPPVRERPANRWISDKTWAAIDKRAALRRQRHLTTLVAHWIGREIKSFLAADCKQCATNATSTVKSHLSNGSMKEALRALKGWYRLAEDRPPPACPETMAKQTAKRVELYAKVPPMGAPLLFNFPYFKAPDGVPTDDKVCKVVRGLQNRQATGATGMKAKHLKAWLDAIQHKENVARENHGGVGSSELGTKWQIFLGLIQTIWDRGEIPKQMSWMVIVLLPKGGGNFQGIGLLDPCWKVVKKIMVCQMAIIEFPPSLHGGLPKHGTGTATIEAKLAQ